MLKRFSSFFSIKKFYLEKETIICDWDYFLCVKDLLLIKFPLFFFVFSIKPLLCDYTGEERNRASKPGLLASNGCLQTFPSVTFNVSDRIDFGSKNLFEANFSWRLWLHIRSNKIRNFFFIKENNLFLSMTMVRTILNWSLDKRSFCRFLTNNFHKSYS